MLSMLREVESNLKLPSAVTALTNAKPSSQALNPGDKVAQHFVSGWQPKRSEKPFGKAVTETLALQLLAKSMCNHMGCEALSEDVSTFSTC